MCAGRRPPASTCGQRGGAGGQGVPSTEDAGPSRRLEQKPGCHRARGSVPAGLLPTALLCVRSRLQSLGRDPGGSNPACSRGQSGGGVQIPSRSVCSTRAAAAPPGACLSPSSVSVPLSFPKQLKQTHGKSETRSISLSFSGSDGKEPACNAGRRVRSPGGEDPLEEGRGTHCSVLAAESRGQRSPAGCSPRGRKSQTQFSD